MNISGRSLKNADLPVFFTSVCKYAILRKKHHIISYLL